jgi:lipopolysaccharide heptosyltransferase II
MFDHLQIYDRRERAMVGFADVALRIASPMLRVGRRAPPATPRRILLLRLERIGDLLMTLEAIEDVRQAAPAAEIDLIVGRWSEVLARKIPGILRVEALDATWLSRDDDALTFSAILARTRSWSARQYDLGINFEPDIRSNMLLAASRAAMTAGFISGGGGPLLDVGIRFDPRAHTTTNAQRLVAAVLDVPPRLTQARLEISSVDRQKARELLAGRGAPLAGIHVSGGRAIKQWDPDRFAELAARLVRARGATIVLTGSSTDRPLVENVAGALDSARVIDLAGSLDLPTLAAVLEQLDVFITGDTGPMHIAAAVRAPIVAVFGPSDPARYAPRDRIHRIVRVDLPCSPCNRIRLPPERCVGHTPNCLTRIDVEMVFRAVEDVLDRERQPQAQSAHLRG